MIFNYDKEIFQEWDVFNGVKFYRKLEYETAFDGIVKIYSLNTDNPQINKLLEGLFFHRFVYPTKSGLFLRQFKSKKSWPRTRLVFLNFSSIDLSIITKTKSSYDNWTVNELGAGKYLIKMSPDEKVEYEEK
jgi:hypothetical protein